MADKDNKTPNVFGGFEALSEGLLKQPGQGLDITDPIIDPEDVKKGDLDTDDKDDVDDKGDTDDKDDKDDKDDIDDTDDKNDDDKDDDDKGDTDDKDDKGDKGDGDDDSITDEDFKDVEEELTNLFKDKLGEELNWQFTEEDKFESIEDLVAYMKDVIVEGSKPVYASDEIKELNDFVTNGGDLKEFLNKTVETEFDFDTIDTGNESDQKLIIKEHLKTRGLKDERIKKSLNRYEDAGVLEEEAEDALELLKEYKGVERERLLESQKKHASEVLKQQQKFYSDVEEEIEGLKDIKGFNISPKEKKDLLNYIFKPVSGDTTVYQKEYSDNVVVNLIEAAYFKKYGDALLTRVGQKASSDAYKKIHQKLKTSKGKRNKSTGDQVGSGGSDTLGFLSGSLLS